MRNCSLDTGPHLDGSNGTHAGTPLPLPAFQVFQKVLQLCLEMRLLKTIAVRPRKHETLTRQAGWLSSASQHVPCSLQTDALPSLNAGVSGFCMILILILHPYFVPKPALTQSIPRHSRQPPPPRSLSPCPGGPRSQSPWTLTRHMHVLYDLLQMEP